jgi:hypothetical protein
MLIPHSIHLGIEQKKEVVTKNLHNGCKNGQIIGDALICA